MSDLPQQSASPTPTTSEREEPLTAHRILPKREESPDLPLISQVNVAQVGSFPVRSELTVLPADPPDQRAFGWTCRTYEGAEVFKVDAPEIPLLGKDDLQPGDSILVSTVVGVYEMTVFLKDGALWAESKGTLANLEFDQDDRHCWASTFAMNKKLLR